MLSRVVEYDAVFLFVILTVAKSYTCVFEGCGIVVLKASMYSLIFVLEKCVCCARNMHVFG